MRAQKNELDEKEIERGDAEKEQGVAEVWDARGQFGGGSAFGVLVEERGLWFGAVGRAEDRDGN